MLERLKTWFVAHKIIGAGMILTFIFLTLLTLYFLNPRASLDAARDYSKGEYALRASGLPSDCGLAYRDLLFTRYNVSIYSQGCLIGWGQLEYDEAYNRVLKLLINRKFGKDIFKECHRDACENAQPDSRWKEHFQREQLPPQNGKARRSSGKM